MIACMGDLCSISIRAMQHSTRSQPTVVETLSMVEVAMSPSKNYGVSRYKSNGFVTQNQDLEKTTFGSSHCSRGHDVSMSYTLLLDCQHRPENWTVLSNILPKPQFKNFMQLLF